MRILRINGVTADIDEQTAIGITLQSYDIKNPGLKKINVSNSFTIPLTANNQLIIGYAGHKNSISTNVYDSMTCDYWIDNVQLIDGARVRITEVSDRINLFIFEKKSFWDELKNYLWSDFINDYFDYLVANGLPDITNPVSPPGADIQDFLDLYKDDIVGVESGIILPMYFSNLYNYDPAGGSTYLEDSSNIYLKYYPDTAAQMSLGGHFCTYIFKIFEFLEYKYSVNFLVNGTADGNIWDDPVASVMYVPFRELDVRFKKSGSVTTGYYFEIATNFNFYPEKDLRDKNDKTVYDLVNAFFQIFNIVKDEFYQGDDKVIRLARFDDIPTDADVVNWSGGVGGISKFVPFIEGLGQNSIIKNKSVYETGDALINSRNITCLNENLDARVDLFEIDNYIPNFIDISVGVVPNLSPKESFKTFTFLVTDGDTSDPITVHISDDSSYEKTASFVMARAALYSLDNEYVFYESINQRPRVYTIKKWLTINDIIGFEFFKEYWILELGGSFFVNKINGFNPDKSWEATEIEIIQTGMRKPVEPETIDYYVDGLGNIFTDGNGNNFY